MTCISNDKLSLTKPLRPFQQAALTKAAEHFDGGAKRVCFVAPTGAGKTRCAVEFIRGEVGAERRVIVLAHRRELVDQVSRTLDDASIDHGIIKSRHPRYKPNLPVQVATVQTLHRRLNEAPVAQSVVIDECHRVMSPTYLDIVEAYNGARFLGLTATPWRLDNKGLGHVYEKSVLAATPSELVAQGYLMTPTFYAPSSVDLTKVKKTSSGEYNDEDVAAQMNTNTLCGEVIDHWRRISPGERTIVFACNVAHSKSLCERFLAAGVAASHVDGTTPSAQREDAIANLRSGETTVLCNVNIATEGLDVPELGCVVLAMVTSSTTRYLQAVGRVMRPFPGKERAFVIDHGGCVYLHGLPTDERNYDLTLGEGESEKDPSYKVCPECKKLLPTCAKFCDGCGHQYKTKVGAVQEAKAELQVFEASNTYARPRNEDSDTVANGDREEPRTSRVVARRSLGVVGAPCEHCGGATREVANREKWGPFGRLTICQASCGRRPWFRTHSDRINATDPEIEQELGRLTRLAHRKGWSREWAWNMLDRQLNEAVTYKEWAEQWSA